MAMIKGITVTLYEKEKINEDPFGKLIYKETPTKVENVLVAPTNTQEVLDALNFRGKRQFTRSQYLKEISTHGKIIK